MAGLLVCTPNLLPTSSAVFLHHRTFSARLSATSRWTVRPRASSSSSPSAPDEYNAPHTSPDLYKEPKQQTFFAKVRGFQRNAEQLKEQVSKLGLAAILGYGLFDGITYTTFFVLAFLGYEKSTGKNPAANIQALLGIVILMWTGNNVTRPFRVAGAAALSPLIDRGLRRIQEVLKLPKQIYAFLLVVVTFASLCFSVIGLLILSRWGK